MRHIFLAALLCVIPSGPALAQDFFEKYWKFHFTDEDDLYLQKYCLRFGQMPKEVVGLTIKEMEQTPIPIDEYFRHSLCYPNQYSHAVRSPLVHYIVEDPYKRGEFLNSIWLYYSKKRRQPEIFTEILNVKNTRGETLLDYIESLRIKGNVYNEASWNGPMRQVFDLACAHGAVYVHYPYKCEVSPPFVRE